MSAPIKLGSAAGTSLIFTTGSKITTNNSGVQSVSITALYGDGQNVFSVLPAAGTPFNEVFGNTYLPSDFKVDITGGGFDIDYIEGKAAKVTINFKRPDPTQPPGPNGQRSRKVSLDTTLTYNNLVSSSVIGLGGTTATNQSPDSGALQYALPQPVVTVTYNIDTLPSFGQTFGSLYAQPFDPRAIGFPDITTITTPLTFPALSGSIITYVVNGEAVTDTLDRDYTYRFNLSYSPCPLGWKLTKYAWQPHADESFFDVTENWQNFYTQGSPTFVGRSPGI